MIQRRPPGPVTRDELIGAQLMLAGIIDRGDASIAVRYRPLWDRLESELARFDDNDIRARARRLLEAHGKTNCPQPAGQ